MNIKEENDNQKKAMYENLKFMRQLKGWSMEKLSKISGIDKKILTQIEEGRDFDVQYLIQLCV